jgi:hypothetical protein
MRIDKVGSLVIRDNANPFALRGKMFGSLSQQRCFAGSKKSSHDNNAHGSYSG